MIVALYVLAFTGPPYTVNTEVFLSKLSNHVPKPASLSALKTAFCELLSVISVATRAALVFWLLVTTERLTNFKFAPAKTSSSLVLIGEIAA